MWGIPRAAAEWMMLHLPGRRGQHHIVDLLETRGLETLNVKELKLLGGILYSMPAVREEPSIREHRLPSSANKQRRMDFLRRGLFRDNACTILNARLLQAMQAATRTASSRIPPPPTAASASASASITRSDNSISENATSPTDSRKRPHSQISQTPPQQHQQNVGLSANDLSAIFSAYYTSQFAPPRPSAGPFANGHNDHGQDLWSGMAMPSARDFFEPSNGSQTMNGFGANGISSATGAAAADSQSTPQNPAEAMLLQQLLEMGFKKQEILDGIRQCQSNDTNSLLSADVVMLHLVSQREEAEEARKEDEVRLLSEEQKQEEGRRREQNQEEALSKATYGEDLTRIFPDSWVLSVLLEKTCNSKGDDRSIPTILGSKKRDDFVEFLKLEEKSRKWYGWVLPAGYFQKVGRRLKSAGDNKQASSWETFLTSEREKLRCGLYELKEQLKGQPKIFLDERPKEKGTTAEIVVIDDD
eukprot:CAMPEP_0116149510 /NCGR_PEP_ID=MMETSP0329-20121206/18999_1 /TAXON_ID=697910 /ORGANISM="Pseudo-nitzschia arenysensis, Strain B593" /LENGTH=473 /DNA_ID=CAMNT_0003645855 /DNA_START=41 /DNA_END=1462 /DNA_ORIENTATION=-